MKQIFDWLREQIAENTFNGISENGVVVVPLIHSNVAKLIINEAEAKWEADCCEWKFEKNTGLVWHCENECESYNISYQRELKTFLEEFKCKCPHCKKPIKISEVE